MIDDQNSELLIAGALALGARRNDEGKLEFTDKQLVEFISMCVASCIEQLKDSGLLK